MIKYFIAVASFFSCCAVAQQAVNEVKSSSIRANFSAAAIEAYEENSFSRIKDFYQYLEIYSGEDASDALKMQVQENIYSLFAKNAVLSDFFSGDKIALPQLLERIKSKALKFSVINIQKETASCNFWTNSYTLKITGRQAAEQKFVRQKIYFYPEEKSFGNKKKEVWVLLLGEQD
ncbi:MAG TPA: hypothetical protein VFR70_07900 [Flavobacterium sp.]|nr:hypothetical protein [Flavobacterium sp.]